MKIVLAAALAIATATPAFADPLATPAGATSVAPAQESGGDSGQRYCIVVAKQTGSYIDRRICRTRSEWMKRGVDPLAPAK